MWKCQVDYPMVLKIYYVAVKANQSLGKKLKGRSHF